MGPSIDKLHWYCQNKFNEITLLNIAIEVIRILKNIHDLGVVHRDIKPSNICYGYFEEKNNILKKEINLIDFGLSKTFTNKNIRFFNLKKNDTFSGTLIFASTWILYGYDHYPKDDLESLFYVLIYLKNGSLPWINNKYKHNLYYLKEIIRIRNNLTSDELFKGFYRFVKFIFKSIKKLSVFEEPEYEIYIKNLELALSELKSKDSINNLKFEWEIKFKTIYDNYNKLNIDKENLMKIAYLKKGYSFCLEEFIKLLGSWKFYNIIKRKLLYYSNN